MMKRIGWCVIGMVLMAAATRGAEIGAPPDPWAEAHQAFVKFIAPIVEAARANLNDPKIHWAEVRNDLFTKYLPDMRIYVLDGAYFADDPKIWGVTKDGKIIDAGQGLWRGVGGNKWFAVEKVAELVKGQKIKVEDATAAVEVAKLVRSIAQAPSTVGMLRLNTKDYTVFDERFLRWLYAPKDEHWKYTAMKNETGWEVKVEYVGPPASIQLPPTYDLVLDGEKRFVDLRNKAGVKERP